MSWKLILYCAKPFYSRRQKDAPGETEPALLSFACTSCNRTKFRSAVTECFLGIGLCCGQSHDLQDIPDHLGTYLQRAMLSTVLLRHAPHAYP